MTAAIATLCIPMVEISSRTLTGPALDWAVATVMGHAVTILPPHYGTGHRVFIEIGSSAPQLRRFSPSTDWGQSGEYIPLFDFSFIRTDECGIEAVAAGMTSMSAVGPDHLVAMCRAVVTGLAGCKIQIPAELS